MKEVRKLEIHMNIIIPVDDDMNASIMMIPIIWRSFARRWSIIQLQHFWGAGNFLFVVVRKKIRCTLKISIYWCGFFFSEGATLRWVDASEESGGKFKVFTPTCQCSTPGNNFFLRQENGSLFSPWKRYHIYMKSVTHSMNENLHALLGWRRETHTLRLCSKYTFPLRPKCIYTHSCGWTGYVAGRTDKKKPTRAARDQGYAKYQLDTPKLPPPSWLWTDVNSQNGTLNKSRPCGDVVKKNEAAALVRFRGSLCRTLFFDLWTIVTHGVSSMTNG